MILLIDVGNTAIKFAYNNINHKIVTFLYISSRSIVSEKNLIITIQKTLGKYHKNLADFNVMCLSSVRPMWDLIFKQIAQNSNIAFFQLKQNLLFNQLSIAINNKYNIGADIIACCFGAITKYNSIKNSYIIVNMGTATVISLILNNQFSGSIIMPGIVTAAEGLFNSAQLLQEFEIKWDDKVIGTNTKEAINIGAVKGHAYAIKEFLRTLVKKYHSPMIIFSGNNFPYISQDFKQYEYNQDLLFQGLLAFYNDQIKK